MINNGSLVGKVFSLPTKIEGSKDAVSFGVTVKDAVIPVVLLKAVDFDIIPGVLIGLEYQLGRTNNTTVVLCRKAMLINTPTEVVEETIYTETKELIDSIVRIP